MSVFPVISTTLSPTHLADFVKAQYPIGPQVTCRIIKTGVNHTYSISTEKGQYILRVYCHNWRTEQEIQEELRLLDILKAEGISVSYPIADSNGQYTQQINAPEGLRYVVLFSYAKGEKLHHYNEELHYRIGVLMAQLHEVTKHIRLDRTAYTTTSLLREPMMEIPKFLSSDTEEMAFMKSAQTFLLQEFEKIDTEKLRYGAVHMDIWFDNLNISKDGSITIFDFDFCGNGWLCVDIAYYIMQLHAVETDEQTRTAKLDSFLKGYESVTPINDEERRILPMLGIAMYFFYLGVQCRRFNDWSNVFLSETYLKRYITVFVKRYYEQHALGMHLG